jgi:tetrahydromethanopterin S-methyltransferase subunit B
MSTLDNPIMENNSASSPWQIAIRYGLILGLIGIVLSLILYLLTGGSNFPSNAWIFFAVIGVGSIIINIVGQVLATKAYRTEIGGYISFGKAFQAAFFTALVAIGVGLIWQVFNETVLIGDMEQYTENVSKLFMEPFGMDPDAIEQALDAQRPLYKGLARNLLNTVMSGVIGSAIFSLIVGAAMKKTPPEV